MWFLVVVLAGGTVLIGAVAADRRAQRKATGAAEPAPLRNVVEVDRHIPVYLTQDQVDAMPPPAAGKPQDLPRCGEGFAFGHASADFATNPAGASLDEPRVLIIDGPVASMRELLAPLVYATVEHPLAIVAADWHPEVLATLAANRRALELPVLAARAAEPDRHRLAELLGIERLTELDLQSGYLPASAIGLASHWSSTASKTWVKPQPEA